MPTTNLFSIVLPLFAGAAAGLVGAFALMKRTVLAGDVMSHIAIPGLGLAVIWRINPLLGGGLTLAIGIFLIWNLQKNTELTAEAAIGVMFATSVALGALLIHSTEDLIDALFRRIRKSEHYGSYFWHRREHRHYSRVMALAAPPHPQFVFSRRSKGIGRER
jgi:hypothetical protein